MAISTSAIRELINLNDISYPDHLVDFVELCHTNFPTSSIKFFEQEAQQLTHIVCQYYIQHNHPADILYFSSKSLDETCTNFREKSDNISPTGECKYETCEFEVYSVMG